ncbi:MAG: hypothetical protein QXS20_07395 [Candidatus Thorarchaeota archaeon]
MSTVTLELDTIRQQLEVLHGHYWPKHWSGIDPAHFQEAFINLHVPIISPETLLYLLDGGVGVPFTNYRWFQRVLQIRERPEPKAAAIAVRGYCTLRTNHVGVLGDVDIVSLCDHIWRLRNTSTLHPSWGASYTWKTALGWLFPAGGPSVLITSLVGLAFLDAYKITRNEVLLERSVEAGEYIMNENGYTVHSDGSLCFHYSPLVPAQITNASAFAALFLKALYVETGYTEAEKLSSASVDFIVRNQRPDGSWYYYPFRPPRSNIVDNYHTGFILESLIEIYRLQPETRLADCIRRGISFYKTMFETNGAPRFNRKRRFPRCIHDAAQGICTFALCHEIMGFGLKTALTIWRYVRGAMMEPDGSFMSRRYLLGKSSLRSPRWADSWMFLGLARTAAVLRSAYNLP